MEIDAVPISTHHSLGTESEQVCLQGKEGSERGSRISRGREECFPLENNQNSSESSSQCKENERRKLDRNEEKENQRLVHELCDEGGGKKGEGGGEGGGGGGEEEEEEEEEVEVEVEVEEEGVGKGTSMRIGIGEEEEEEGGGEGLQIMQECNDDRDSRWGIRLTDTSEPKPFGTEEYDYLSRDGQEGAMNFSANISFQSHLRHLIP